MTQLTLDWYPKSRPGIFGGRAQRKMRERLLAGEPPPKGYRAWHVRRVVATPPWADMVAIRAVYLAAERLTIDTGVEHHVDHIVPLAHPLVCGLHVHWNLKAIPAGPNMRKGNRFGYEQLELF